MKQDLQTSGEPSLIAPAPWTLSGDGHIIISLGGKATNLEDAGIHPSLKDSYLNLCNIMMFVDYKSSPVGPYRELLYIPGAFKFEHGKRHFSISRIYVDSYDSTWNGRKNWGIPKEMAEFNLEVSSDGTEHVRVMQENGDFASYSLNPKGPKMPINLNLVPPIFRTFGELLDQLLFVYTFNGKGRLQWSHFKPHAFDKEFFPDMTKRKSVLALKVSDFELTFPISSLIQESKAASTH